MKNKLNIMCFWNGKPIHLLYSYVLYFINPLSFGIGDPTDAQPPWRWRGGFLTKSCAHPHLFATFFIYCSHVL